MLMASVNMGGGGDCIGHGTTSLVKILGYPFLCLCEIMRSISMLSVGDLLLLSTEDSKCMHVCCQWEMYWSTEDSNL